MKKMRCISLITVLLALLQVAPLQAALTQEEVDALYDRIDSLYEVGIQAYNNGQYTLSISPLKEAIALQKTIAEDEDLLNMCLTLSSAQSANAQYEQALQTSTEALTLSQYIYGAQAAQSEKIEANISYLRSKIDMPVEVRTEVTHHTVVREIAATTAQQLFSQATSAYQRGVCDSARMLMQEAIQADTLHLIYDADIHTATYNIAACRMHEARQLKRQGAYRQAIALLEAIEKDAGVHAPTEQIESEIASCYSMDGDYEHAISLYKKVLSYSPTNHAVQNNLAICYARIGDYTRSLSMLREALQGDSANAELLLNISTTCFSMGDYEQALLLSSQAAQAIEEHEGTQSAAYAKALTNVAACHTMAGHIDEALSDNLKALAIQQTLGADGQIASATTLNNIADCYYRRLEYDHALEALNQAAAIRRQYLGEKHPDYISTINNIATCYLALGNKPNYTRYKQQCLDWTLADVRNNFTWLTEQQRQIYIQQRSPLLAGIVASACPAGMQYDKQLLTKGMLLSSTIELERIMYSANDSTLLRLFAELRTIRIALDELYAIPGEEQDRAQIERLNKQAEQLEQQLLSRSQAYGNLTHSLTYHWQDIQQHLKTGELAIEFAREGQGADAHYMALLLRKGWTAPKSVQLGTEKDYMAYVEKRYRAYEYEALGNAIWQEVLQVGEVQDGETIYFAPDGFLYQMGIEYLTTNGRILNDTYAMYRLSSTRVLCDHRQAATTSSMALFGGLLYGPNATKGDMFKYLPATLNEVQDIAALYPGAALLTGAEGTEQAFYALSGHSPSHLHIATHGFYIQGERAQELARETRSAGFIKLSANSAVADNSLSRTGLLMTNAESAWTGAITEQRNDGVLTAREIMLTDLHTTDLAVLSACQTGMGDIEADGVSGLQRGIKKAGVQTLMMSLWDVNDEATRMLMTTFYEGLRAGKSKREALRDAQQRVRTFVGNSAQAQRAISEEEAYMQQVEEETGSLDRAARPLKFLRQNGNGSSKAGENTQEPKVPYAAPRYWAAFILLDALD